MPSSHGKDIFLSSNEILWCLEMAGWASALVTLKVRFLLMIEDGVGAAGDASDKAGGAGEVGAGEVEMARMA